MNSSETRVGVYLKSFLGDAVMATPLVFGLNNCGFSLVTLCCSPANHLLNSRVPGTVLKLDKARSFGEIIRQARFIKSLDLDAIILVNRSFRSALVAKLSGVKIRSGHSTELRKSLLTYSLPYSKSKPEFECYSQLANPIVDSASFGRPYLSSDNFVEFASEPTVAIQPGARYESKRVPIKAMAKAANELYKKGYQVVLVGGTEEKEFAQNFLRSLYFEPKSFVGDTSISQVCSILSSVNLVIGSDTGLLHIAAGLGTPTIAVFGPNPASKWGHNYDPHIVLEAPGGCMENVSENTIVDALAPFFKSVQLETAIV